MPNELVETPMSQSIFNISRCFTGEVRSAYLFENFFTAGRSTVPIPRLEACTHRRVRRSYTHKNKSPLPVAEAKLGWTLEVEGTLDALIKKNKAAVAALPQPAVAGPQNYVVRIRKDLHIPAVPVACQVVVAGDATLNFEKKIPDWATRMLAQIGGLGYVWTLSQADRNKLTHALNGNIEVISWLLSSATIMLLSGEVTSTALSASCFIMGLNYGLVLLSRSQPRYLDVNTILAALYDRCIEVAPLTFLSLFQPTEDGYDLTHLHNYVTAPSGVITILLLLLNTVRIALVARLDTRLWRVGDFLAKTVVSQIVVNWFMFVVLGWDIVITLLFVGGVLTLSLSYLSAALGAVLLLFILFSILEQILFTLRGSLELWSLAHNVRLDDDNTGSSDLLTDLEFLIHIFSAIQSILAGEAFPTDSAFLAAYRASAPWVTVWILAPLRNFAMRFTVRLWSWILKPQLRFSRHVKNFLCYRVPVAVENFLLFFVTGAMRRITAAVVYLMVLPLNVVFHTVYGDSMFKTLDYLSFNPESGEGYDSYYTLFAVRFAFSFFVAFVLYPMICIIHLPLISGLIFWISAFSVVLACATFLLALFGVPIPTALSIVAVFLNNFPIIATHGFGWGASKSIIDPFVVRIKHSTKKFILDQIMIAHHWLGHKDFVMRTRGEGGEGIRVYTIRDDLPDDVDIISALFYHQIRNFNLAQLDLVAAVALCSGILITIYVVLKRALSVALLPVRVFVKTLIIFIACLCLPNIFYELTIALLFHSTQRVKAMSTRLCEDVPALMLWLERDGVKALRFMRALIRFAGLQGWFLLGYLDREFFPDDGHFDEADRLMQQKEYSKVFAETYTSQLRATIKRFILKIEDFRLPEFIQAQYNAPTPESIRTTYKTLYDLGFPIDKGFIDSIDAPNNEPYLNDWASLRTHILAVTNFKFSVPRLKAVIQEELRDFGFPEIPGYIHTGTYSSINSEIESTERYWTEKPKVEFSVEEFTDILDAAWDHVAVQYKDSKLSSPWFIFKHWVKKYNMGFGFMMPKAGKPGRYRQMRRAEAIKLMGGKAKFLRAWSNLFKVAAGLVGVSPVFTKLETLKLKKAINKQVRTVIGSAFTHSVLTYVFNFKPNHNYHPFENSSKVGVPINGVAFSRIFESVAKHQFVWAGDMTAFDSSLPPVVVRLCAEIRKRGYDTHADAARIHELIDIAYEQLINQPLGFKSLGAIFAKDRGLSTGHTSTTPDNTLSLLICYLFAWRRVTGLRAREFFNYNTLANFGDDHILGWDAVFGWSPQAAARAMAEIGVIMRDEGEGQTQLPDSSFPDNGRHAKISFLAKQPLHISGDVLEDLRRAGITEPLAYAVCHDKARLVGKIKGQIPANKNSPFLRRARLLSFIQLTAHHKDVYNRLRSAIERLDQRSAEVFRRAGVKLEAPPSYQDVVRNWYKNNLAPSMLKEESELSPDEADLEVTLWEASSPVDYIVRWLSDVPTMLSPRYKNMRFADWIQGRLCKQLSWPLAFIGLVNGVHSDADAVRNLTSRTPYNFLRHQAITPYQPYPNATSLYVRHWLFNLYIMLFVRIRSTVSFLDYIRVLDHAVLNSVFIALGKVIPILVELDLHVFDIIVIALLDFLSVPEVRGIQFLSMISPNAPSTMVGLWISNLIGYLFPAGSVDLQPLTAELRAHGRQPFSFILDAQTGTGKSTRMVNHIQEVTKRCVVVIEPRHILAAGLCDYMNTIYPASGIYASTEGYEVGTNPRVIYCTAQSFLLSANLRNPNNLFILDEAHVNEPAYDVARRYLQSNHNLSVIYSTATPDPAWNAPTLTVPAVNSFSKTTFEIACTGDPEYLRLVSRYVNSRGPLERQLIFVKTLEEAKKFRQALTGKCCILSSRDKTVDPSASVYIATSVADAGITIPDVVAVHTTDVGVTVSNHMWTSRPVYFKLPEATIKQRAGRTGRTSNGLVYLYRLPSTGVEPGPPEFTPSDYVNGVGAAITKHYHLLPVHVQQALRDALIPFTSMTGEVRSARFSVEEALYDEFDVFFGLNSKDLLDAVKPFFARSFTSILDDFKSNELGNLFSLPEFVDIGIYGDNNPAPSQASQYQDGTVTRVIDREKEYAPQPMEEPFIGPAKIRSVSPHGTSYVYGEASAFEEHGPLDFPYAGPGNEVQPQTYFDHLEPPRKVLTLAGLKHFYGVLPSQEGIEEQVIEYPQSDSSLDTYEFEGQRYRPESPTGHVDVDGIPHAYREFETPRAISEADWRERVFTALGPYPVRFGGTVVSPADVSDLPKASALDIVEDDSSDTSSSSSLSEAHQGFSGKHMALEDDVLRTAEEKSSDDSGSSSSGYTYDDTEGTLDHTYYELLDLDPYTHPRETLQLLASRFRMPQNDFANYLYFLHCTDKATLQKFLHPNRHSGFDLIATYRATLNTNLYRKWLVEKAPMPHTLDTSEVQPVRFQEQEPITTRKTLQAEIFSVMGGIDAVKRQPTSGAGLLCGARALHQALMVGHSTASFEEVLAVIRGISGEENYFASDHLVQAAYHFGFELAILTPEGCAANWLGEGMEMIAIWHDGVGHYENFIWASNM